VLKTRGEAIAIEEGQQAEQGAHAGERKERGRQEDHSKLAQSDYDKLLLEGEEELLGDEQDGGFSSEIGRT
jgi:hypothetical protein